MRTTMNVQGITADRLFDGTAGAALTRPLVWIDDERIREVTSGSPAPGPLPTPRHFPGCTILPGLIDTHVHLVFSALETNAAVIEQVERESDEELLARALANAAAALKAGLTTV